MVRKEIYVHLIAYNLLRALMWEGAQKAAVSPLKVSLQATRQHFGNFLSKERRCRSQKPHKVLSDFVGGGNR
jgi:hypothetical protein